MIEKHQKKNSVLLIIVSVALWIAAALININTSFFADNPDSIFQLIASVLYIAIWIIIIIFSIRKKSKLFIYTVCYWSLSVIASGLYLIKNSDVIDRISFLAILYLTHAPIQGVGYVLKGYQLKNIGIAIISLFFLIAGIAGAVVYEKAEKQ